MNALDWIVVVCVLIFTGGLVVYYAVRLYFKGSVSLERRSGRVLFVIAHPDDECMFFAPTIVSLTRSGQYDIFLLCLSSGNYYGEGRIRQKELLHSCCTLGIRQSNVFVIDHRDLPDDPSVEWSSELIAKLMVEHVKNYYIDMIFTFDKDGVSGHANHKSVHSGLRHLLSSHECPAGIRAYQLVSVNIFRKYVSFLELVISFASSRLIFISSWRDVLKAQAAMYCHKSQFRWFRVLYIIFSRYMIVNTYTPVIREAIGDKSE